MRRRASAEDMSLGRRAPGRSALGSPIWSDFPSLKSGGRSPKQSEISTDTISISRPRAASRLSECTTISDPQDAILSTATTFQAEPVPQAPPFDQDVDVLVYESQENKEVLLAQLLHITNPEVAELRQLPFLPSGIRRQVYGHLFPSESRRICLSPRSATKAAFPNGYFANPWDVLKNVMGGIGSSRALRQDLMTYFWSHYAFHVTINHFNGPYFCPLSEIWLKKNLFQIQHLTVEVDLTKFDCSYSPDAPVCSFKTQKIRNSIAKLVAGLICRQGLFDIAELNLMCRRYSGIRPSGHEKPQGCRNADEVPFCPEEYMSVCDDFKMLQGIIGKCRMSGFSQGYTHGLLQTLFKKRMVVTERPQTSAWPVIPSPTISFTSTSFGQTWSFLAPIAEDERDIQPRARVRTLSSSYCGSEMNKIPPSVPSPLAPCLFSSTPNLSHQLGQVIFPGLASLNTPSKTRPQYDNAKIQTLSKTNWGPNNGDLTLRQRDDESPPHREHEAYTFSPVARRQSSADVLRTPDSRRRDKDRNGTPRRAASTNLSPKTPNTMNSLNEQDPAYMATLEAMRSSAIPRQASFVTQDAVVLLNASNVNNFEGTQLHNNHVAHTELNVLAGSSVPNQVPAGRERYFTKFVNKLRGISES